jgi:type IV pilus assembly protein PilW
MNRNSFKWRASRGLSLVELMIAMLIGLLLTAAVIQIFISSKNTFRMQESMARLQENGRFAVSYLASDIRMAGYMGCANIDRVAVNNIAVAAGGGAAVASFDSNSVIVGENNVAAGNVWGAAPGTDTLVIQKVNSGGMRLTGNMATNNANIQVVDNSLNIQEGDILFITDCINADIFRATNVSNGTGSSITIAHAASSNASVNLSKLYGSDAEILMFESVAYYVKETGRTTPNGDGIRALYVQRQAGKTAASASSYELVEGVQDLQLEFGVDTGTDNFADEYRTANNVSNWGKVVSSRFSLLMQGVEGKVLNSSGGLSQSINYNGSAVAADGRVRQVFGSAVAVRNRVP